MMVAVEMIGFDAGHAVELAVASAASFGEATSPRYRVVDARLIFWSRCSGARLAVVVNSSLIMFSATSIGWDGRWKF